MKPFYRRILICLTPVLLSLLIVSMAINQYVKGEGGFKLGVDLVGGTILVYEIDQDKKLQDTQGQTQQHSGEELAAALKRRIDPTDLYNVIIRPLSDTRVEIILPTGGAHQAIIEERNWQELIQAIKAQWPQLADANLDVGRGDTRQLAEVASQEIERSEWSKVIAEVKQKWAAQLKDAKDVNLHDLAPGRFIELTQELKKAKIDEAKEIKPFVEAANKTFNEKLIKPDAIDAFIKDHYKAAGGKRQDITGEHVLAIKKLISEVGSLEFRILANASDDRPAIDAAQDYFRPLTDPKATEEKKDEIRRTLENFASRGLPPPRPVGSDGKSDKFTWKNEYGSGDTSYSWVQLAPQERYSLGLDNAAENPSPERLKELQKQGTVGRWQEVAKAREANQPLLMQFSDSNVLLYSRRCIDHKLQPRDRAERKYEYFVLTRDPEPGAKISGQYLTSAKEGMDAVKPSVHFTFNTQGGNLFYDVTSKNRPSGSGEAKGFHRLLAIILDDKIISAPRLNEAIRNEGQITGNFSQPEVARMVRLLRSGALPATLKPLPVSENTIGPTLGAETISAGTTSVGIAFIAVLIFMVAYYRFAGLVACVALFANLLMTIAFMVLVNATFTLPGLAGLVLMLAMAVDANVLIYERLREERDRGASLSLAIRNGYDRAFPTIIDTHLTSIFTAIVLYAVGNDQLKGFGISLAVGLVISLFTSLYMTRLMFDLWNAKGWLHKLSMARLLTNPNINFMRVRNYWFTATVLLSLFGVTVFLLRGAQSLNIDFTGGTAYTGVLEQPMEVSQLRHLLDKENQDAKLNGVEVKETDDAGLSYTITYKGQKPQSIKLPNPPVSPGKEKAAWRDVLDAARKKWPDKLKDVNLSTLRTGGFAELQETLKKAGIDDEKEIKSFLAQEGKPYEEVQKNLRPEREQILKERASVLPDWSVEQRFTASEADLGGKSSIFTVRTSEKAPELVQAILDRLLRDESGKPLMKQVHIKDNFQVTGRKATLEFTDLDGKPTPASPDQLKTLLEREAKLFGVDEKLVSFDVIGEGKPTKEGRYTKMRVEVNGSSEAADKVSGDALRAILVQTKDEFARRPQPESLENFDSALAADSQSRALYAILLSWGAILMYLWFRFGGWTFGTAAVLCLIHDLTFTLGIIAFCHYIVAGAPWLANLLLLQDFKIDFTAVAALLTLIGYSVSDTIVVFDRIREVRGKNPELTEQMINDSVNQTLSRTLLTAFSVFLVVLVLYLKGGDGIHLFAFVMVIGVVVGTYSSIYVASPLLLIFGEGRPSAVKGEKTPEPEAPEREEEEEETAAEKSTTKSGGKEPEERIKAEKE